MAQIYKVAYKQTIMSFELRPSEDIEEDLAYRPARLDDIQAYNFLSTLSQLSSTVVEEWWFEPQDLV